MTKVEEFIKEVEELCLKYNLQITVSGYDAIQIWDLTKDDKPIYAPGIEDKIK